MIVRTSPSLLLLSPPPANESISASLRKVQLILTPPHNSRRPLRHDHLHPGPLRTIKLVDNVEGGRAIKRCMCEVWKEGEEPWDW